jgi:TRAP-type mannitol/chloroaromatic compound transport system permease small subunit
MTNEALEATDHALSRMLAGVAWVVGWLFIAMIAMIMFDVVSRRFFVLASLAVQELQWHFHTALFTLAVGYAYIRNSHVRIDIVRDRLSERRKAWIELLGVFFFLVPYCCVVFYFSFDYAWGAFQRLEGSRMPGGLPYRFIVKSTVPIGLVLLLAAGAAVAARSLLVLRGARSAIDPSPQST